MLFFLGARSGAPLSRVIGETLKAVFGPDDTFYCRANQRMCDNEENYREGGGGRGGEERERERERTKDRQKNSQSQSQIQRENERVCNSREWSPDGFSGHSV